MNSMHHAYHWHCDLVLGLVCLQSMVGCMLTQTSHYRQQHKPAWLVLQDLEWYDARHICCILFNNRAKILVHIYILTVVAVSRGSFILTHVVLVKPKCRKHS